MLWLYALIGFTALMAGLLAIPLHFRFRASLDGPGEGVRKSGRILWAFGLVDIPLGGGRPKRAPRRRQGRPAAAVKKRGKRAARLRVGTLLKNPLFWARLRRLSGRLWNAVRFRLFRFDARFGLDDPADTGVLWGLIAPWLAVFVPPRSQVAIRPAFDGPALTFHSEGEVRLIPLQVGGILLAFALSPATWRVIWPAVRKR